MIIDAESQGSNLNMTDPRFTTVFDGVDDLLSVVDVDEVGDIETLLMFLFDRPVGVEEAWDDDGVATGLDVLVRGNAEDIGSVYEFPMSILELARACAQTADELGPFAQNGTAPGEVPSALGMGDAELITALQRALGKVRLLNMMDFDD